MTRPTPALPLPSVGLGTFQLEGATCERIVREALHVGYRHVDTAHGYGNEERIGRAIAGWSREELFLTTKVWRDHLRKDALHRECEASLRRLRTDYLDLYLVHWPNRDIPIGETVEALLELVERGRIRAWGVSNFTERHLGEVEALGLGTPMTNQVELHPYFPQHELERFCAERGIVVTAYSPLARGLVTEDEVLRRIASDHGRTAAQVTLRWILQRGCATIPKTSVTERLRENLDVFDFELSEKEMAAIGSRPRGDRLFDYEWSEFDL